MTDLQETSPENEAEASIEIVTPIMIELGKQWLGTIHREPYSR